MATAQELISGAMRLCGILAEGESPTAAASADALTALNQLIDSMTAARLNVFSTQDQTFTWPAATATRTVGATGQLVGTRPVEVSATSYYVLNNITYPLKLITQGQYDEIAQKTLSSTYPEYMLVDQTMPDTTITLYPVPSGAISIHIICVSPLTQPAALSTSLSVPPGYLRYFRFALAKEICSEFGLPAPAEVEKIYASSMRIVKRINANSVNSVMNLPMSLTRFKSDIFTG